jgi:hypothetical protein
MKKRGIVFLVVLVLLFSSFVSAKLGDNFDGTIFRDRPSYPYTYALGIGEVDEQDCTPDRSDMRFGILGQRLTEGKLEADFPTHHRSDLFNTDVKNNCVWRRLPLQNMNGCYFFSSESDSSDSNDCNGWIIPPTENTISGDLITARGKFFDDDDVVGLEQNFLKTLPNSISSYLDRAEFHEVYDGKGPICLFNEYHFKSPDMAFTCIEDDENYKWYICDEAHLSEDQNKFIPLKEKEEVEEVDEGEQPEFGYEFTSEEEATHGWFCEENSKGFVWDLREVKCEDGNINCDQNKQVCLQNDLSFIPTTDGGMCCGLQDSNLGEIRTNTDDNTEYICLRQDVGKAEGVDIPWGTQATGQADEELEAQGSCVGDWCWVSASSLSSTILSIKKPNNKPYDVVSNNENWVECRSEDVNYQGDKGVSERLVESDELKEANRFYCYHEGDRWSWAES